MKMKTEMIEQRKENWRFSFLFSLSFLSLSLASFLFLLGDPLVDTGMQGKQGQIGIQTVCLTSKKLRR